MGFLQRKRSIEAQPISGREDLVMVRGQEFDALLEDLAADALEAVTAEKPPDEVARHLSIGFLLVSDRSAEGVSEEAWVATQSAARVGYMVRAIEYERFDSARHLNLDLAKALSTGLEAAGSEANSTYQVVADAAARCVRMESMDPGPDDQINFSWEIPGLGGEARRRLREDTILAVVTERPDGTAEGTEGQIADLTPDDVRRSWKFGFFFRCFEEPLLNDPRQH